MATHTHERQSNPTSTTPGAGVGPAVHNEAYNVMAALKSKLEGLEAYRKYLRDGNPELWQRLNRLDQQGVELLTSELERLVHEGKLRPRSESGSD